MAGRAAMRGLFNFYNALFFSMLITSYVATSMQADTNFGAILQD